MLEFDEGDEIEILEFDDKTQDGYWLGRCKGKVCFSAAPCHLFGWVPMQVHRVLCRRAISIRNLSRWWTRDRDQARDSVGQDTAQALNVIPNGAHDREEV